MVKDSYSTYCYIENKDGQYHIECDMNYGDKKIYSDYNGDNFIDGLNSIIDDITAQVSEPEESPEDKIARLENSIAKLQAENNYLNEYIKNLKDNKHEENCEKDASHEHKKDNQDYKIDETIEHLVNEIVNKKSYKSWIDSMML